MTATRSDPLEREAWLTQYGRRDATGFRMRPRPGVETAISLIGGRLAAEDAHRLIVRHGRFRSELDTVRYVRVRDLVDAGFRVRRDPTPLIPQHVLVEYEGEWDDDVAERFDTSFRQPES